MKLLKMFIKTCWRHTRAFDATIQQLNSVTKQGGELGFRIKNQLNFWFNPETDTTQIKKPESSNQLVILVACSDILVIKPQGMKTTVEFSLNNEIYFYIY